MTHTHAAQPRPIDLTDPTRAKPLHIGDGFDALSFEHGQFAGLMDPLVMVDHFTMTTPTFGAHPHAGMSAVSVLFEDSEGRFHNRDSLGNELDLRPGDLYWLKAGRGAVHDEAPRPGSRIHALQIFVNLPANRKQEAPDSLHVRAADMPIVQGDDHRVRVVLGDSNGVVGASSPALPLTILDVQLDRGGAYLHRLPAAQGGWLHAVRGDATVTLDRRVVRLQRGQAIALRSRDAAELTMSSDAGAQLALSHGTPLRERFVQQGPFVMSNGDELKKVAADYAAGRLGSLA